MVIFGLTLPIIELTLMWKSLKKLYKKLPFKVSSEKDIVPDTDKMPFYSLSPINDADPDGPYIQALYWGLKNRKRKNIKNIALTGPYGSGKSSILRTLEERYEHDKDLEFLQISLATFKENALGKSEIPGKSIKTEQEEPDAVTETKEEKLTRLIELSILQQIFYHEKDEKIPDSRFKKIKSFSQKRIALLSVCLAVYGLAIIHQIDPDLIKSKLRLTYGEWWVSALHFFSLGVFVIGSIIILYRAVKAIRNITISKFSIQNADIEVNSSLNKSILNHHLDEILYFFEVTPYTVVIIEDLDRFQETEIFTKLRELNQIINKSKKIMRDVTFIYAIRDDMFLDKDRTKFFDFIVPIIPVINSSNSSEKLLRIIKDHDYKINDELIEDISLFIDDMRLLYNIANEYFIYREKLDKKLNQNKLLAMVVYKNIFPNDFVDLSNDQGILHTIFTKKDDWNSKRAVEIDLKIKAVKKEISDLESLQIIDVAELRKLYVLQYQIKLSNLISFEIDGTTYDLSEVIEDDPFHELTQNNANYLHFDKDTYYNGKFVTRTDKLKVKFQDIEKEVDSQRTYVEREELITSQIEGKIESLKEQLDNLDGQRLALKNTKIKEIAGDEGMLKDILNAKQRQLISILLRSGYIDEHYQDFVSIFYEGSITVQDREYLLNVKSQYAMDFDYQLSKIDKLVPKISLADYYKHYILNYQLVDHLLTSGIFSSQRKAVIRLLADESLNSTKFIDGFMKNGVNHGLLLKELAKVWPKMWAWLEGKSMYTKEKLEEYYGLVLQNVDVEDIKRIAQGSGLSKKIAETVNFLSITNAEKVKAIVKSLAIKFTRLDLKNGTEELRDYIYESNFYAITPTMIVKMIKAKGKYIEKDFQERNYYAVINSGCKTLLDYINNNITDYVQRVYLQLDKNVNEDADTFVLLLNDDNLHPKYKNLIIEKTMSKVEDVSEITTWSIVESLFQHSRVVADWNNLIHYYFETENAFDDVLVGFINRDENALELSENLVNIEDSPYELETVESFLNSLLLKEEIANESYEKILESIPYIYTTLEFGSLSAEKVSLLVSKGVLKLTKENYDLLRSSFGGEHIKLAERNAKSFIDDISTYELSNSDRNNLLKSSSFTVSQKNVVLEQLKDLDISKQYTLLLTVADLVLSEEGIVVSKEVVEQILLHSFLHATRKVRLFNKTYRLFSSEEYAEIFTAMEEPFSKIAIPGKKPLLENNKDNWELASRLKLLGYVGKVTEEKNGIRINIRRK